MVASYKIRSLLCSRQRRKNPVDNVKFDRSSILEVHIIFFKMLSALLKPHTSICFLLRSNPFGQQFWPQVEERKKKAEF